MRGIDGEINGSGMKGGIFLQSAELERGQSNRKKNRKKKQTKNGYIKFTFD